MAEVAFDYTNLREVEGGLTDGDVDGARPRLEEAVGQLLGDPPGFM